MARIIIAEDEEALRGFVVRALGQDGHEVFAAPAVPRRSTRPHGGRLISAADIKMPVMDGHARACGARLSQCDHSLMTDMPTSVSAPTASTR
jgi:CheY-like chemotaxis protein